MRLAPASPSMWPGCPSVSAYQKLPYCYLQQFHNNICFTKDNGLQVLTIGGLLAINSEMFLSCQQIRSLFYANNIHQRFILMFDRLLGSVQIIIALQQKQNRRFGMNSIGHYKNVKALNGMIESYEKKLDDKISQMFHHIINSSSGANQIALPVIDHKRILGQASDKSQFADKKRNRTQSFGSKSFVVNRDLTINQQITEADSLLKTFKDKIQRQTVTKKIDHSQLLPINTRSTGGQTYAKPKVTKKKPQILSKEMRWDPFCDKNAIKAQDLNQGMLSLIERGKVGRNIDIITAFEKGRPVLEMHPAIFHHAEQKFTDSDLIKSNIGSKITLHKQTGKGMGSSIVQRRKLMQSEGQTIDYRNEGSNNWALTMPEDQNLNTLEQKDRRSKPALIQIQAEIYCLQFLHYRLVKDEGFLKAKRSAKFSENWGEILQIIHEVEKVLQKYNVEIIYCNANKMLSLSIRRWSLKRITTSDIEQLFIKPAGEKQGKILRLSAIVNKDAKRSKAATVITSAFMLAIVRSKYISVLLRKKYENKLRQWINNGKIIKNYRKQLEQHRLEVVKRFEKQQRAFRDNLASLQQNKHYEIHIVNRQFMNKFRYFEQYCCTEITRIFNLENANTNIIYISPFELSVETVNYYFKIMELEEIDNYSERVTFLELEDITSKVKLPPSMNSSQKLYFNSKALRKLKNKVEGVPAYFVTNYPSEVDIKLSVFLGIPIYSGDFHTINPLRSALSSPKFAFQSIQPTPSLAIDPKQYNSFELSNVLMRYFESNKRHRKYVLKINNYSASSGIALLMYPFSSLPEMYTNTVFVQPYYFKSVEKFYLEFARQGGVVQKYEEGTKSVTVSAKIASDQNHVILGTFEKVSSGFVNISYIFPQRLVPHKQLIGKTSEVFQKLAHLGHIGYVELTIVIAEEDEFYLQEIELFSTKITNSLFYFKFLAGGYLNHQGEFMTKVAGEGDDNEDEEIVSMESRSYCYIPFMLHFGLTEKQAGSFFQLCRIGGVSFDLESKFGTTFIILGSLKDTMGVITTAKDRKSMLKLASKTAQFLVKQNSHNLSTEMIKEKQERAKQRFSISSIKDRIEEI